MDEKTINDLCKAEEVFTEEELEKASAEYRATMCTYCGARPRMEDEELCSKCEKIKYDAQEEAAEIRAYRRAMYED